VAEGEGDSVRGQQEESSLVNCKAKGRHSLHPPPPHTHPDTHLQQQPHPVLLSLPQPDDAACAHADAGLTHRLEGGEAVLLCVSSDVMSAVGGRWCGEDGGLRRGLICRVACYLYYLNSFKKLSLPVYQVLCTALHPTKPNHCKPNPQPNPHDPRPSADPPPRICGWW